MNDSEFSSAIRVLPSFLVGPVVSTKQQQLKPVCYFSYDDSTFARHNLPLTMIYLSGPLFFWMLRSVYRRILISIFFAGDIVFVLFVRGAATHRWLIPLSTGQIGSKTNICKLHSNWQANIPTGATRMILWARANHGFGWMNIPTADVAYCWAVHGVKRGFEPQPTSQKHLQVSVSQSQMGQVCRAQQQPSVGGIALSPCRGQDDQISEWS